MRGEGRGRRYALTCPVARGLFFRTEGSTKFSRVVHVYTSCVSTMRRSSPTAECVWLPLISTAIFAVLPALGSMAPHLTKEELEVVTEEVGKRGGATPLEVWKRIREERKKKGVEPLAIWAIRRAVEGMTHRRARPETRGRKRN